MPLIPAAREGFTHGFPTHGDNMAGPSPEIEFKFVSKRHSGGYMLIVGGDLNTYNVAIGHEIAPRDLAGQIVAAE